MFLKNPVQNNSDEFEMIHHRKSINSNFPLGVKMCKKSLQNTIVTDDVGKHLQLYGKVKSDE